MTEDRKPETPGMSEVSAKFMDGAEAAVEAATSTDEALLKLWQEHEQLTAQYDEATRQYAAAEIAQRAITETETPEYATAAATAAAAEQHQQEASDAVVDAENRMEKIPACTVTGTLFKLRVAGADIAGELIDRDGVLDETAQGSAGRLTLSALADLERLVGAAGMAEDPVLVLKREWEARYKALDEQRDTGDDSDEARQPFYDRLHETEVQILRTPATTLAGIAVKLILWARLHCMADEVLGLSWNHKSIQGRPLDLGGEPVLSALLDLERMSSETVTEAPAIAGEGSHDITA